MGTKSFIIVKIHNNLYKGVYCHYEGYPEHNGKILHNHYNTLSKAIELIENGSISYIGETLELSKFNIIDKIPLIYDFQVYYDAYLKAQELSVEFFYMFDGKVWSWCDATTGDAFPVFRECKYI